MVFSLTPAQVDAMAAIEESSLPARCVISRATLTDDPTGGGSRGYTDDSGTVPCDVVPVTDSESVGISSGRETAVSQYIITIPRNNELKSADQIKLVTVDENDDITAVQAKFEIIQPGTFDPLETAIEIVGKLVQ